MHQRPQLQPRSSSVRPSPGGSLISGIGYSAIDVSPRMWTYWLPDVADTISETTGSMPAVPRSISSTMRAFSGSPMPSDSRWKSGARRSTTSRSPRARAMEAPAMPIVWTRSRRSITGTPSTTG